VPRPLEGQRVLELSNFIAGPFCGMLLADLGADVIKIEPPGRGDMTRATPPLVNGESAGFMSLNRNKRSLALDLKQPEAVEVVLKLAKTSDVLLENFRPGVMEGLGLGAERLRAANPDLIVTNVSGFGQTGPARRKAAVNLIVEAASGLLSVIGEPGQVPARPGVQMADVLGALFATYGILGALVGRLRHGQGRTIDVSMLEGAIAAAMWETSGYLSTGEVPRQLGRRHRVTAPYQLFRTSDGYIAIGGPNDSLFKRMMDTLGLSELLDDPRFVNVAGRKANDVELGELIEAATIQRPAEELLAALEAAGVPCSRVNDYAQVFDDPQVKARGVVVEVEHPKAGRGRWVRNPLLFDQDGPAITRPAPLLGQHSREILIELGYEEERITRLVESGAVGA
jgi:crotonobetainyl-CoA:carnitine CoA-transferase CaiB-like acyl-CoA transferase